MLLSLGHHGAEWWEPPNPHRIYAQNAGPWSSSKTSRYKPQGRLHVKLTHLIGCWSHRIWPHLTCVVRFFPHWCPSILEWIVWSLEHVPFQHLCSFLSSSREVSWICWREPKLPNIATYFVGKVPGQRDPGLCGSHIQELHQEELAHSELKWQPE